LRRNHPIIQSRDEEVAGRVKYAPLFLWLKIHEVWFAEAYCDVSQPVVHSMGNCFVALRGWVVPLGEERKDNGQHLN